MPCRACGPCTPLRCAANPIWSFEMRMRKKADLPHKNCLHCGLPFAWRKKWEKDWDDVKYCSERCRNERKRSTPPAPESAA